MVDFVIDAGEDPISTGARPEIVIGPPSILQIISVPEPFTPTTDPWEILGRLSVPGSGDNSERFGETTTAIGNRSLSVGALADAGGDDGIAIGYDAFCSKSGGISIGSQSRVRTAGADSIAVGRGSISEGTNVVVIGPSSTALGSVSDTVAVGRGISVTSGENQAAAIGSQASIDLQGTAVGALSSAAQSAVALGHNANASHEKSIAIGKDSASTAVQRATVGKVGGAAGELIDLQVSRGLGVFGAAPPTTQPTVTGSRGGNAALASLLTALAATGIIIDGTSA